ncbi:DUF2892 domain-containing protein [Natronococcus sp. JC468]|uniref:YgaP family membrane protein n=1 Tax=Natronococcus sp. JC468 TaxID=1961921 RepID=UPI00143CB1CF|nr:DUF2892 domain-containing protein [Natronococcus sp. JC468]NKE37889.1 DUF2892 domain-containing protein [Natronococcus sp. JC468]
MDKNVGGYDRGLRSVVGPVLVVVGLAGLAGVVTIAAGMIGTIFAALLIFVGAVLTVTAVTQKCPMNTMLGINTYRGSPDADGNAETDELTAERLS